MMAHSLIARTFTVALLAPALALVACTVERRSPDPGAAVVARPAIDSISAVPDSAWIDVQGPTVIGFFPRVSDDRLGRDQDLAELLDHFSFNLGIATDSLEAHGFRVTMRSGDTLWLRARERKWRFVRSADSALVGFYFALPDGRDLVYYGSGAEINLVAHAKAFLRPAGGTARRIIRSSRLRGILFGSAPRRNPLSAFTWAGSRR